MTCDEECVRTIVKEELANMSNIQTDQPKKTKKKSAWNIFLSDCTKKQPPGTPIGDRAKACSIEYKELKKNGTLEDYISKLPPSLPPSKNKNNDNMQDSPK